jgi:multicomponent Na+:H+ antiporter subunit B
MEDFIFVSIVILAILVVFLGSFEQLPPIFNIAYLILMNLLIGLKVACGFLILFYRFIAVERR